MTDPVPGELQVAVAVIEDDAGRILLTRRAEHLHQGGLWEFPGGKLEPGENIAQALQREIREELGIEVLVHRPLIRISHAYPDRRVVLDVQRVTSWRGEPRGMEGQPLSWVAPEALSNYPLPVADGPVVTAIRLPALYLITPAELTDEEDFLRHLAQRLQAGIRLVQLRLPGLTPARYRALAQRAAVLCHRYAAQLILNAPASWVEACGADGVHLSARRLRACERRPLAAGQWVAASCHDQEELQHAARIGVDFVVISPVLATTSHPEAVPLGWQRFQELVREVAFPVYALGGMTPGVREQAWSRGAQGIAAIRGLS